METYYQDDAGNLTRLYKSDDKQIESWWVQNHQMLSIEFYKANIA
jgi:hypothetical protein